VKKEKGNNHNSFIGAKMKLTLEEKNKNQILEELSTLFETLE